MAPGGRYNEKAAEQEVTTATMGQTVRWFILYLKNSRGILCLWDCDVELWIFVYFPSEFLLIHVNSIRLVGASLGRWVQCRLGFCMDKCMDALMLYLLQNLSACWNASVGSSFILCVVALNHVQRVVKSECAVQRTRSPCRGGGIQNKTGSNRLNQKGDQLQTAQNWRTWNPRHVLKRLAGSEIRIGESQHRMRISYWRKTNTNTNL